MKEAETIRLQTAKHWNKAQLRFTKLKNKVSHHINSALFIKKSKALHKESESVIVPQALGVKMSQLFESERSVPDCAMIRAPPPHSTRYIIEVIFSTTLALKIADKIVRASAQIDGDEECSPGRAAIRAPLHHSTRYIIEEIFFCDEASCVRVPAKLLSNGKFERDHGALKER